MTIRSTLSNNLVDFSRKSKFLEKKEEGNLVIVDVQMGIIEHANIEEKLIR